MMKIKVKIGDVELSYEGSDQNDYPRIVTGDKYITGQTKSERLMEVIKELIDQAKSMHEQSLKLW